MIGYFFFELTTVPKPSKAPKGKINKNILVVAIENKYTVLGNSTVIDFTKDVVKKHKNTHLELLPVTKKENIVFVVMARRPYTSHSKLPQNTFVLSQDEYHALIGPTMLYLLKTVESMERRSSPTTTSTSTTRKRSKDSDGKDDEEDENDEEDEDDEEDDEGDEGDDTIKATKATKSTATARKRHRDSDDEQVQPQKKKQKTVPCKHKCKDKTACGHDCCKRV